jgi:hypothetical protein
LVLHRTVADAGVTIQRPETVAWLIPIGYVAGRLSDAWAVSGHA